MDWSRVEPEKGGWSWRGATEKGGWSWVRVEKSERGVVGVGTV